MRTPFAVWLNQEIESRGWKPKDFSDQVGTSKATVSRWLSGKNQPTLHVADVARALQLPIEVIYQRMGERPGQLPPDQGQKERESKLLTIYRRLPPPWQAALIGSAEVMLEKSGANGGK